MTAEPIAETAMPPAHCLPRHALPLRANSARRPATPAARRRARIILGSAGFTVLEVMVAIALMAVLAATAAPSMLDFVRNNRLGTSARQLDADLLLARREAIKRNTRVIVCPVGVGGKCAAATATVWKQGWLVCYDANSDNDCDDTVTGNPNPIRRHDALDPSLTLTGPTAFVRFNANGTQGAVGAATVTFTTQGTWSGSRTYTETIGATGNVALAPGS